MNTASETNTQEVKNKLSLQDIINQNPNAELGLEKLEKQLGLNRHDLLQQIRGNKNCALKVGRKGAKSTCLTGEKATAFNEARAKYLGNHNHKKTVRAPRHVQSQAQAQSQGFQLRIEIGGKEILLPVTSELVAAA